MSDLSPNHEHRSADQPRRCVKIRMSVIAEQDSKLALDAVAHALKPAVNAAKNIKDADVDVAVDVTLKSSLVAQEVLETTVGDTARTALEEDNARRNEKKAKEPADILNPARRAKYIARMRGAATRTLLHIRKSGITVCVEVIVKTLLGIP